MKYTETTDKNTGAAIATITFSQIDFVGVAMDEFDKHLITECNKSNLVSDKLLGLHTIAKKLEEEQ